MSPTTPATTSRRTQPDITLSDDVLLLGFGRRDPEAERAFVQRYQRRVYGLARSLVGDPSQAEEIAQEAFIRAWRNAGSYDARRGPVSSWLLTITRNLAIDALRRKRAQPTDPSTALFLDLPDQRGDSVDAAIVNDDIDRVRAALRLLPDEQRRALLLAAFYGLSAREISETESIPLGTAKTRIRSSLKKVRSLLGDDESSDGAEIAREVIRTSALVSRSNETGGAQALRTAQEAARKLTPAAFLEGRP
jgi:RNA polymerase sigma-70 factor (ECF subfamily)